MVRASPCSQILSRLWLLAQWLSRLAMLPAFFLSVAVAQENVDRTFQNWMFRCEKPAQRCYVFQNVHLEATGQKVIGVVAGALGPNGERILHFTVPLGIHLPVGVVLKIDDAAQFTAPVETCIATGCELAIPLDDPRLKTLLEALVVRVGFLDAVTRRQITVAISMQGFKDAYAAMTDE